MEARELAETIKFSAQLQQQDADTLYEQAYYQALARFNANNRTLADQYHEEEATLP